MQDVFHFKNELNTPSAESSTLYFRLISNLQSLISSI